MSWDKTERRGWDDLGLVFLGKPGHALGYGLHHGFLRSWPHWVKRLIVKIWNPINCRIWGHYWFGPIDDGDVHIQKHCVNCSRKG